MMLSMDLLSSPLRSPKFKAQSSNEDPMNQASSSRNPWKAQSVGASVLELGNFFEL